MAETFNLGQVAPISKGNYAPETQYKVLNTVYAAGGSWLCLKPAIGIEPGITPGWNEYWMPMTNGVKDISLTNPKLGVVNITFTYTDGHTSNFTYNSTALAANSVGTPEIKNAAVTNEKISPGTINKDRLSDETISAFAPAYNTGTTDMTPGVSALATGTLYIQYENEV